MMKKMSTTLAQHQEEFNDKAKQLEIVDRMQAIAKSTVEEFDLKFEPWKKREYAIASKIMYFVPEDIKTMTDRQIMAEVLHNMWHALYTKFERVSASSFPEPKRKFIQLINAIEDIRIEEQMMMDYPGVFDNFIYKFRKQDSEISASVEEKLDPDMQYLYMMGRRFRGKEMIKVKPEVLKALEDSEEILYEAYAKENTNQMVSFVSEELRPIFETLIKPPEEDDNKDEGKNSLRQKAKNAINLSDIIDEMKKQSKAKPSEWEWEGSEWEEDTEEKEDFGKDIDAELDEAAQEGNAWDPNRYGQDDPVLSSKKSKGHEEPKLARDDMLSYEQMYKEVLPVIPFFVKKLRSIMTDNNYNRQGGSYRSGKLNTKKLYRRKANSDRIFSRKIIRRHKDYAVSLLIDESGSMCSNEKNRNAAKATVLLSEVLNKVGIPFEIRGFNAKERVYKKANEGYSWKHRRQVERIIIESHWRGAHSNNDGFAVNRAAHHLSRVGDKDTERILIVMSDGLPAETSDDIPKEDTLRLPASKRRYSDFDLKFEVAQASRKMTCIGVGINAHHVQEFYPQNALCDNVIELPRIVLGQLKKNIRRG